MMSEVRLRLFLACFTVTTVGMASHALLTRLTNNHFLFSDPYYPRVSATLGNPIYLAGFLVIAVFVNLFCSTRERNQWFRAAYLAASVLGLLCIVLTRTRGAVVGIVVAIVVSASLYLLKRRALRARIWVSAMFVAFVVVVTIAFMSVNRSGRHAALGSFLSHRNLSALSRLAEWRAAVRGMKDHPFLGTGPENYYIVSNKYLRISIQSLIELGATRKEMEHNATMAGLTNLTIMLWRS